MGKPISRTHTETRTILILDVVGYTKTTTKLSREQLHDLLVFIDNTAGPLINAYDGRIIKKMGDAFLVTFLSATDAVLCGIELQRKFGMHSKHGAPVRIRIVIHQGDVLIKDDDIFGDAVNTTARMEKIAKPGHIVFSQTVFDNINKQEIPILPIGEHRFKGLKRPLRLYRVKSGYDDVIFRKRKIARFFKTIIWLVILGTIILFLLDLFLNTLS